MCANNNLRRLPGDGVAMTARCHHGTGEARVVRFYCLTPRMGWIREGGNVRGGSSRVGGRRVGRRVGRTGRRLQGTDPAGRAHSEENAGGFKRTGGGEGHGSQGTVREWTGGEWSEGAGTVPQNKGFR